MNRPAGAARSRRDHRMGERMRHEMGLATRPRVITHLHQTITRIHTAITICCIAQMAAAPHMTTARLGGLRTKEFKMKKLLLAATALAVIASPALAKSGSRKVVAPYAQAPFAWQAGPLGAYAQSPGIAAQPYAVYEHGRYVGADPDPNVRLMLRRDAGSENF
jgi:hypothetical protein